MATETLFLLTLILTALIVVLLATPRDDWGNAKINPTTDFAIVAIWLLGAGGIYLSPAAWISGLFVAVMLVLTGWLVAGSKSEAERTAIERSAILSETTWTIAPSGVFWREAGGIVETAPQPDPAVWPTPAVEDRNLREVRSWFFAQPGVVVTEIPAHVEPTESVQRWVAEENRDRRRRGWPDAPPFLLRFDLTDKTEARR